MQDVREVRNSWFREKAAEVDLGGRKSGIVSETCNIVGEVVFLHVLQLFMKIFSPVRLPNTSGGDVILSKYLM